MASIKGMLPDEVMVIRDARQLQIPAEDLVTGDIVQITLGNKVPADVRFIDVSSDLKLDRAVLTGESEPIAATINSTDDNFLETKNIGLQGTLCVSGSGHGEQLVLQESSLTDSSGVVIQTGDNTVFGRIAKLSSAGRAGLTTLQKEILRFVLIIVAVAITLSIIIIICWAAWLNKDHKGFITPSILVVDIVAVCVAFIPEGLPASITISLAVVANKLSNNKVLCKSLMTVETLGSVDVLCSDKTGTLTCNRMTVTNAAIGDEEVSADEAPRNIAGGPKSEGLRQVAAIAALCNAAEFDEATKDQPLQEKKINGDATGQCCPF